MTKHIVAAGVVLPFPVQNATEGFVEFDDEQEAAAQALWVAGGVLTSNGEAVLDPKRAAEMSKEAVSGFLESAYGSERMAAAIAREADSARHAASVVVKALASMGRK